MPYSGRLESLLSTQRSADMPYEYILYVQLTQSKQPGQDEGDEQQGEADSELQLLADAGSEGLVRRSVPDFLE